MNRRIRILAGVLTLAALTFSFAETVLASVCTSMAAMGDMGDMGPMVDAGERDPAPALMDCMLIAGSEGTHDAGERNSHCPLNPAVGSGCAAAASLPAADAEANAPTSHGSRALAFEDVRPDLLLTHALFRPPRA